MTDCSITNCRTDKKGAGICNENGTVNLNSTTITECYAKISGNSIICLTGQNETCDVDGTTYSFPGEEKYVNTDVTTAPLSWKKLTTFEASSTSTNTTDTTTTLKLSANLFNTDSILATYATEHSDEDIAIKVLDDSVSISRVTTVFEFTLIGKTADDGTPCCTIKSGDTTYNREIKSTYTCKFVDVIIYGSINETSTRGGFKNSGNLTLYNCKIYKCSSTDVGGAINTSGSSITTLINTTIDGCKSSTDCGGVYVTGSATAHLINTTIQKCSCTSSTQGVNKNGGGFYCIGILTFDSQLKIVDCKANVGKNAYFHSSCSVNGHKLTNTLL